MEERHIKSCCVRVCVCVCARVCVCRSCVRCLVYCRHLKPSILGSWLCLSYYHGCWQFVGWWLVGCWLFVVCCCRVPLNFIFFTFRRRLSHLRRSHGHCWLKFGLPKQTADTGATRIASRIEYFQSNVLISCACRLCVRFLAAVTNSKE